MPIGGKRSTTKEVKRKGPASRTENLIEGWRLSLGHSILAKPLLDYPDHPGIGLREPGPFPVEKGLIRPPLMVRERGQLFKSTGAGGKPKANKKSLRGVVL